MKKPLVSLVLILALMTVACRWQINRPQTKPIPEATFSINEQYPAVAPGKLILELSSGKVAIGGGSDVLIDGTVVYNLANGDPVITHEGSRISISQRAIDANMFDGDVRNDWNLRLGSQPIDLEMKAGAYEGRLDFSGVPLRNLELTDGASQVTVMFDQPNPVRMEEFRYLSGASNLKLGGLLNANFNEMDFKGGAGNFSFDFSGTIQGDTWVKLDGGVGNISLSVPADVKTTIRVTGGLSNISTDGAWVINGKEYRTKMDTGPELRIDINIGMGNLKMISQ